MRIWAGVIAVVGLSVAVQAGTVRVPADYSTIQSALDVSSVGDTVLVAPGTYSDYVIYGGHEAIVGQIPDGVVLASELGADVTTIDLEPLGPVASRVTALACTNHTSGLTVIDGFRITGFPPTSGGIAIGYCTRVEVRHCLLESAVPADPSIERGGVSTRLSDVAIRNCSFIRCSLNTGAGIGQVGGSVTVEGCTFLECANQGIRAIEGTGAATNSLTVLDCLFEDVSSMSSGGCISTVSLLDGVVVDGCRFKAPVVDGSRAAAMSLGGFGSKIISNNVFENMSLSNGASCIKLQYGDGVVRGNTFAYLSHLSGYDGVALYTKGVATVVFENNVVAHTANGKALSFEDSGPVTGGCNVFWDNAGGIGYVLHTGDRIIDPLFCDEDARDLTLHASSPCLPANSLGCGLIGALGQGCGSVSVEAQSWGKTKSAYRTEED
jgi:hypothetical protein